MRLSRKVGHLTTSIQYKNCSHEVSSYCITLYSDKISLLIYHNCNFVFFSNVETTHLWVNNYLPASYDAFSLVGSNLVLVSFNTGGPNELSVSFQRGRSWDRIPAETNKLFTNWYFHHLGAPCPLLGLVRDREQCNARDQFYFKIPILIQWMREEEKEEKRFSILELDCWYKLLSIPH